MTGSAKRWDGAYSDRLAAGEEPLVGEPSLILRAHEEMLPHTGDVAEVASGLGRNAGWLARRGLSVLAVDVSQVAVHAINSAAAASELAVQGEVRDVETEGLGDRTFDLIVITYFVDRDLLLALPNHLAPNGVAVFAQPTVTNLERNPGPSARFSLGAGEVHTIADALQQRGLEIVTADEQWRANNTHEAWLVVRQPR